MFSFKKYAAQLNAYSNKLGIVAIAVASGYWCAFGAKHAGQTAQVALVACVATMLVGGYLASLISRRAQDLILDASMLAFLSVNHATVPTWIIVVACVSVTFDLFGLVLKLTLNIDSKNEGIGGA